MCYAWGEGGSAFEKKNFPFIFEHFSQKKSKKNTRTSMAAAVTSLPRVRFFILHFESGLVLKIVFENVFFGGLFRHFFIFHFRALLTKEMRKEHAHINGGGCNKLATCSFFNIPLREWPRSELELELIQTQMTQKPMLRAEVYARALRASQNRKEDSL